MTTTPGNASSNLPGKPPVVDLATWETAREELLVREKAQTREGDAVGPTGLPGWTRCGDRGPTRPCRRRPG